MKSNQKSKIKNELKELRTKIFTGDEEEKREIGLIEAADNALKNRVFENSSKFRLCKESKCRSLSKKREKCF